MLSISLLTISLLATIPVVLTAVTNTSVVDLGYVKYQGVEDRTRGTINFYGLKYAAPPTGNLRWREPVIIEHSNDYSPDQIINATSNGPQCYQAAPGWVTRLPEDLQSIFVPSSFLSYPTSEDCLLLDVLVPSSPISTSLPVMVQIHGGGYTGGNSMSAPGNELVSASNGGLIYVSIQYRLGAHGFMAGDAVRDDGIGNAGLLDQRAAIRWVQRNIRAFGGDPTKVTLIGGSAGGGSVTYQMLLYGGEPNPPFRAAIAEYPAWIPHRNGTILNAQYYQLLEATNCNSLQCLRSVSSEALANATNFSMIASYERGLYGYGDFYYSPTVDGEVLRDLPTNELRKGHFTKVPLLTNRDGYEGLVFTNFSITTSEEVQSGMQRILNGAKRSFFTRLFQLYPLSDYTGAYFNNTVFSTPSVQLFTSLVPSLAQNSQFHRMAAMVGDWAISCVSTFMASVVSENGPPVWKMNFYAGSELHGATGLFLFAPVNITGNATLAAILKDYYISFATHLDPNAVAYSNVSKPFWPEYLSSLPGAGNGTSEETQFVVLRVNQTDLGAAVDDNVSDKCDFFYGHGDSVRY